MSHPAQTPETAVEAEALAAASATAALAAGPAIPEETPFSRVVRQYRESRMAMAALVLLLVLCGAAILAPVISPQNPYDLNAIDINDARLPPGAVKMSPPARAGVEVMIAPDGAATTEGVVREDFANPDTLSVTVTPVPGDPASFAVTLEGVADGPLDPLVSAQITSLPRGATLSAGEKPRFGGTWRLSEADLDGLVLTLPETPDAPFDFRADVSGGGQDVLMRYWLGSDDQGRDMLSAILYGLRISLAVAGGSVVVALVIGTLAGVFSAWKGGTVGALIMRLVDLQMSFPTILVALILLAILGPGVFNVVLALVIVQWALYARVARGAALAEINRDYVTACQSLALSPGRILLRHVLPNCAPSLSVIATLEVAHAISLEATLSFLGLGLPITEPSLGLLVSNGFQYLLSGYPWISILPGVAILIAVLAINLVGDALRDILNPRLAT